LGRAVIIWVATMRIGICVSTKTRNAHCSTEKAYN
jgi:hypothetical protein